MATAPSAPRDPAIELDALIIGAGFSGLYALHHLRTDLGLSARVYEAADGVGGTWYWNRYPGARCDSESHYYCFSFSEELNQEWEWSSRYPEQPEILRYLNHVADRFDLRRHIEFQTRVVSAHFDESTNRWLVETDRGQRISAHYVISAVGCLSAANLPEIPGLDRFEGRWFHTGRWPHEPVDFTGERVGLIGTGSSGIQATPVLAAQAKELTVFQRTPNYSVPAGNMPLTPARQREIKANYKEIWKLAHANDGGFPFVPPERLALDCTQDQRDEIYQDLWDKGGFQFTFASFADVTRDKAANDTISDFIRRKIGEMVKDPDVAEKLMPRDYPYASKRPPIDTAYFETFNRENVTLVDLKESPIVEITPKGVRTEAGEVELDSIVFATGFDAMTGSLLKIDIRGVGGRTLAEHWKAGPRTYLGLQMAGFPNLFTITGPGSPSVLCNMPVCIEQHVEWIGACIEHMRRTGASRIEATEEAETAWVEHVNEAAQETLFYEAASWYVGANIPGKPRIFMPYPGGLNLYRERCDEVAAAGYLGFELRS
jgi:cation diffusion facilitator CzcD-associated flavoprotein CzcO